MLRPQGKLISVNRDKVFIPRVVKNIFLDAPSLQKLQVISEGKLLLFFPILSATTHLIAVSPPAGIAGGLSEKELMIYGI